MRLPTNSIIFLFILVLVTVTLLVFLRNTKVLKEYIQFIAKLPLFGNNSLRLTVALSHDLLRAETLCWNHVKVEEISRRYFHVRTSGNDVTLDS